jgi:hypothetical protein
MSIMHALRTSRIGPYLTVAHDNSSSSRNYVTAWDSRCRRPHAAGREAAATLTSGRRGPLVVEVVRLSGSSGGSR